MNTWLLFSKFLYKHMPLLTQCSLQSDCTVPFVLITVKIENFWLKTKCVMFSMGVCIFKRRFGHAVL